MRYIALATDYDNTIADDGAVLPETLDALRRLKDSGRLAILVTGRMLDDLVRGCDCLDRFDLVVAENGALLYDPATKAETLLAPEPPAGFVDELRRRGVAPLESGRSIVATHQPHETTVLDVIREQALEMQIIFNRGAVMILPSGVDKASGLAAALERLGLSAHNVIGVGDAENDHAFLRICGCAAAVSNSIAALKSAADLVTSRPAGAGVVQIIDALLDDDLARLRN